MTTGEQVIHSKDGTSLFVKQYHAAQPVAQALVHHGYLEHCGRYREFGEHLASKGISVTTWDVRGHGKSGGDRPVIRDWAEYEEDLEAVATTLLPRSSDGLPTFLMGHSNGGLVVLNYLLGRPDNAARFDGVVVTSPYVAPADSVPWVFYGIIHALGRWFPTLTIPSNLTAADVTRDPQKQKEHEADGLIQSRASIGWASRGLKVQARLRRDVASATLDAPVLFVYSAVDKVANPEANKAFAEALSCPQKTILRREGEEHEVLNEIGRKETFAAIEAFVREHAAASPAGKR